MGATVPPSSVASGARRAAQSRVAKRSGGPRPSSPPPLARPLRTEAASSVASGPLGRPQSRVAN
eukprot:2498022-Alexandrium_andersonii.AAC.1